MQRELKFNMAAAVFGLAAAVLTVALVDAAFGWANDITVSRSRLFPEGANVDGLGWSARNRSKLRATGEFYTLAHREVAGGNTIFDVTYTFDQHYRRIVPGAATVAADQFALFFGGSQTFGEGLSDADTIPAQVQRATTQYRAYNYAYSGYGPHQVLRKLQSGTVPAELGESRGIAFYQYFGFHLHRVIGTMSYVSWAGGAAPYYRLDSNGELQYRGSFASGRFATTLAYWLLGRSAIASHLGVDLPRAITAEHHELFCRVISASRDAFEAQFEGSRFVVIVSITNGANDNIIPNCLAPNHIDYIDLRGLESGAGELTFPGNGHFTPRGAQLVADQLVPLLEY